ncbi:MULTISPECIES: nucleotidyltransferase family protein [unclassified Novosphingobium]|uniref:nucleotidyltransferase family protein n=1 Tax=unclassified Novosphingobium TaxID=2644732 RepID=UPI0025CF89E9|nr:MULTISPECIES: nucleotidyltransferase family protein [unclassified Novosphingobium]HQV02917.1 nucleotidyltransferase family protein [Novosphingobium sp.]
MPGTAMVMAAGKGTRMMPLTASKPKPLVEVAGTTLLDHVLDLLRGAGVGRIVVNVHYFADQIEQHLERHADDFVVVISDERDLLRDTGGGLIKALPLIPDDPFFCINADNWFADTPEHALERMARAWDPARMDVLMLVVPFARAGNSQGQGDFDLDAKGRLSREGPKRARPYVWTGIQMLAKKVVCDPPAEVFSTNVFWNRAIAAGRCHGIVHQGDWFDVGYPEAITMTEAALGYGG